MNQHTVSDEHRLHWSLLLYDRSTMEHCERVALLAGALAIRLGWSVDHCRKLVRAARLHDIGKLKIPRGLLQKPGPLTPDEYLELQRHTEHGVTIVSRLVSDPLLLAVIGSHHERWDGHGYPHRLAGERIPFAARIVAVADTYDALAYDRPYRLGLSPAAARDYLLAHSGSHFDPLVVQAFTQLASAESRNAPSPQHANSPYWYLPSPGVA